MCQPLLNFCSISARPLLYGGAAALAVVGAGLAWLACGHQSIYNELSPGLAQARELHFYLQLAGCVYLVLIALLAAFAARFDRKNSVRTLAVLTSINFVLAVAAVLVVPGPDELDSSFKAPLSDAQKLYDFKEKPQNASQPVTPPPTPPINQSTAPDDAAAAAAAASKSRQKSLTPHEATSLWDKLQARGCCGYDKAAEWGPKLPKSCCKSPEQEGAEWLCKQADDRHQAPCKDIILDSGAYLRLALLLAALTNLYLATVTCANTYRTLRYSEASQSAYS